MIRDALGGVPGSSLSIFTGFSKDFEDLKIRKLKVGQNTFEINRIRVQQQLTYEPRANSRRAQKSI